VESFLYGSSDCIPYEECTEHNIELYVGFGCLVILGYLIFLLLRPHGMLSYFKIAVYYLQMQSFVYTSSNKRSLSEVFHKIASIANMQVELNSFFQNLFDVGGVYDG